MITPISKHKIKGPMKISWIALLKKDFQEKSNISKEDKKNQFIF
jgi:hypothetical protein